MRIDADDHSAWLPGDAEAFKELRWRAMREIARNDDVGRDIRQSKTRLRDASGRLLFEGTMEQATRAYPEMIVEQAGRARLAIH